MEQESIYLGEKVVNEKEYLSAMIATCSDDCVDLREGDGDVGNYCSL